MSIWEQYPSDYRASEVNILLQAARSGECAAVVGLSGSGKSNLLGFMAHCLNLAPPAPRFALADCNRLNEPTLEAFCRLVRRALEKGAEAATDELEALESVLDRQLAQRQDLCLLLDRFDALFDLPAFLAIAGNLRALRDQYKYQLTYVIATRRPLDPHTELAELFFAHTLWLGPLEHGNALWSARRDALRLSGDGQEWSLATLEKLIELSGGYPSLLRAACDAYAAGAQLEAQALCAHPAAARRIAEFWADEPSDEMLQQSRLVEVPMLAASLRLQEQESKAASLRLQEQGGIEVDVAALTAKEHRLLECFIAHAGEVCEKDDLVRAVWPEDVIFQQGIRDESLAQLVRRLRVKIEADAGDPKHIQTVAGRGYIFRK